MTTLVGKEAPSFEVDAVVKNSIQKNFTLASLRGKNVVLFFYPLDFTFVCPTELHAFQEKLGDFHERNTIVVGCSVDSVYSHMAWLQTPSSKGGVEGIEYPLISDLKKEVARGYGVLKEEAGIAYRGLFLIDKAGIVRHQLVNDLPLGRSVDEALRMVDALIFFEENGEVCPANWQSGEKSMEATPEGLVKYFSGV
ncbi:MAG: peroxiredoxin [Chlamydiales bacterium]